MREYYDEYRGRNRSRGAYSDNRKSGYSKRFFRQLAISVLCFCAVYSISGAKDEPFSTVSKYIKTAVNYRVDTGKISGALDAIVQNSVFSQTK